MDAAEAVVHSTLWNSKTSRAFSPVVGGLLGFVYALVSSAGTYRGWYWPEANAPEGSSLLAIAFVSALSLAIGGSLGGFIAGVFADNRRPLAVAIVAAPFAFLVWLAVPQIKSLTWTALAAYAAAIVVAVLFAALGGAGASQLRGQFNKGSSPLGIWWPHWLYFPLLAYYAPIYMVATVTNIWIDLRLGVVFTFNPATWFWWKAWVYYALFSWFAAAPTYVLILGYARLFEQMQVDAATTARNKFNAFFLYFLTVPAIAWFLTFAWRWVVGRLFSS